MNDDTYSGWNGPGEAPEAENEAVAVEPSAEEPQEEEGSLAEASSDAEVGEEPPLYAGKYKTPAELERAYSELERKLGQREYEERMAQQEPVVPDGEDPMRAILSKPVSQLAVDSGPWDEWVQENYGYDPATMSEADWLEVKTDVKQAFKAQEEQVRTQQTQLQMLDAQITTAFAAEYPAVMQSPALTAAAKTVTEGLWNEVTTGVRPFEGPEAFARLIGETLKAQLAGVGPVAMGAYNAQRQVARPHTGVPGGGVTPNNPTRQIFDPNKYKGWDGPKD